DGAEELVRAHTRRPAEARHGVQAPLEAGASGAVVAQPDLGAVDVGVHGIAEALVQGEQELQPSAPHAGGHDLGVAQSGPWSRRKRSTSSTRRSVPPSSRTSSVA